MKDSLLKNTEMNEYIAEYFINVGDKSNNNEYKDEKAVVVVKEDYEITDGCGCSYQCKMLILGGIFMQLTTYVLIVCEFAASYLDEDLRCHQAHTAWLRFVFGLLCFLRGVFVTNLIVLAAQVKRNAIYIYPFLVNHHAAVIVLNFVIFIVEVMLLIVGRHGIRAHSWIETLVSVINLGVCCYCSLIIYHQYNNGWHCGRRVVGEERDKVLDEDGPMEIFESNRGPITSIHIIDTDDTTRLV